MSAKMRTQCTEMAIGGGKEGGTGRDRDRNKEKSGRHRLRETGKQRYCWRERQRAEMKRN